MQSHRLITSSLHVCVGGCLDMIKQNFTLQKQNLKKDFLTCTKMNRSKKVSQLQNNLSLKKHVLVTRRVFFRNSWSLFKENLLRRWEFSQISTGPVGAAGQFGSGVSLCAVVKDTPISRCEEGDFQLQSQGHPHSSSSLFQKARGWRVWRYVSVNRLCFKLMVFKALPTQTRVFYRWKE